MEILYHSAIYNITENFRATVQLAETDGHSKVWSPNMSVLFSDWFANDSTRMEAEIIAPHSPLYRNNIASKTISYIMGFTV